MKANEGETIEKKKNKTAITTGHWLYQILTSLLTFTLPAAAMLPVLNSAAQCDNREPGLVL